MNPQDYPSQSNQDPTTPSPSSTEAWFNNLPSPDAPTPGVAPQKSPHKKLLAIGIIVTVLLLIGGGAALVFLRPKNCLTNAHYAALTGTALDEQLSAADNFYTRTFDFTPDGSELTAENKAAAEQSLKKISEFYKTYSKEASIIISLTSDFYKGTDTQAAATKRLAKLKSDLQQSGIPESAIRTTEPVAYTDDGELSSGSEELKTAKAYLTITSDPACRQ